MWTWVQSTGRLYHNGDYLAAGYSGFGEGRNNPLQQEISNSGPCPCGMYTIAPPLNVHIPGPHGPFVLPLLPAPTNAMFGRSGFLIHGDAMNHPGQASHGCLIVPRWVRDRIWASGDRDLTVIPRESTSTLTASGIPLAR